MNDFFEINKSEPKVALCGLAYKPNIDDLRESPAVQIVDEILKEYNESNISIIEPNIINHKKYKVETLDEVKEKIDLFFILVGHNEFKILESKKNCISFVKF